MTWRPDFQNADPATGWIGRDQLDEQQRQEAADRDFRTMLATREHFERSVAALDDPTPTELAELWAQADQETRNALAD